MKFRTVKSRAKEAEKSQDGVSYKNQSTAVVTPVDVQRASKHRKYNAVGHGIFAKVVLEGRESKQEFDRFVRALGDCLQPEGALESVLVSELAMLYWRLRRLMEAEKNEILKGIDAVRWDRQAREASELKRINKPMAGAAGGLLQHDHNPLIVHECVQVLQDWRASLAHDGLSFEGDTDTLAQIYGNENVEMPQDWMPRAYLLACCLANSREARRETGLTRERVIEVMKGEIDAEIERLTRLEKTLVEHLDAELKHEEGARIVPERFERFIRYEVMLSRRIERTLNHLERLQRRRLGDGDLPPIKVDISS